jgi:hypothetical protein
MKTALKVIYRYLFQIGIDLRQGWFGLISIPKFISDFIQIKHNTDKDWPCSPYQPCLADHSAGAGTIDRQYFYQDTYVSRKILNSNPDRHIDIGSRIDGFIAQLSIFRTVEIIDIRPLSLPIENVKFIQGNICEKEFRQQVADSVSCLHTIEHIGLGRYGDPIGVDLWKLAVDNIWSMVKPEGKLYISTPIGKQRIVFNAHRVFKPSTLLNRILGGQLLEFAYVNDEGEFLIGSTDINDIDELVKDFEYGLGIFIIQKAIEQ